ncbi:MAG: helix-turn-helix domain-containing protein, partial [Desulfurivibrionaceae bacterium]
IILPESLTLSAHRRGERHDRCAPESRGLEEAYRVGLDKFMADQEKTLIKDALEKSGNSKTRAAELLKTSFRSLRYKAKKYEL